MLIYMLCSKHCVTHSPVAFVFMGCVLYCTSQWPNGSTCRETNIQTKTHKSSQQRYLLTLRVCGEWTCGPVISSCAMSSACALNPWMEMTGSLRRTSSWGTRFKSWSTWKLGTETSNATSLLPAQSSNSTGRDKERTEVMQLPWTN